MHPPVIGIVGPVRAGKTTAATYLVEKYGYRLASNSQVLKEILVKIGIQPDRESLGRLGDALFEVLGNEIIARARVAQFESSAFVVDGIRYHEEVEFYRGAGGFLLLGITAPEALRFERAIASEDVAKSADKDAAQFKQLASTRSEMEVPALLRQADCTVENTGSIERFRSDIDAVLEVRRD